MKQIYTHYVYKFDSYFEAHRYFLEEVRYLKTMYSTNEQMKISGEENWYVVSSERKPILVAVIVKENNTVKVMFDKEEYERITK